MSIALEMSGIAKRYVTGAGHCLASVNVLRGVDLAVRPGDVVAIVGPPGSGKSTLLLVAAGLLRADQGEIRWFGDASRAAGARVAVYHLAAASPSPRAPKAARIHLLDDPDALGRVGVTRLARWMARRCAAGDAMVIATRHRPTARALAPRVLALAGGQLHVELVAAPRVAESAHPIVAERAPRGERSFPAPIEWGD
jgi:lipoprotein-releasing system ATP-binding protein